MGGYRPLPPCFAAFYKVIGLLKRNVINGKLTKLDLLKKLELKSHLEKSTDSGAVITSDLDQSSQDLQTDASMSTSDKFTMYPSIPVIRPSTETKTSLANSVVVTPVVSSRNELLTCYHTPDVSLHDMSNVSVTSVVSPLTQPTTEMMTMSTDNVLSATVSSSAVTQLLTHVESFNNPQSQINSSAIL